MWKILSVGFELLSATSFPIMAQSVIEVTPWHNIHLGFMHGLGNDNGSNERFLRFQDYLWVVRFPCFFLNLTKHNCLGQIAYVINSILPKFNSKRDGW